MGFKEILLVVVVILLLFGAKKIPQLMQGMGRGIREFSDAKKDPTKKSDDDLV
jgi:sec-independent protein translocase protein TatA